MSNASVPQTGREKVRDQEATEREQSKRQQEIAEEHRAQHGPLQTSRGVTTLNEAVVAKIAGMAAREVPGVYDLGSTTRRAFSAVADRIPNAQTSVTGGISVEKGETQASVDVVVVVEYGASIVDVAGAIRRNIIEQVEGSTGLEVIEVNVNVIDVHLPDDDDAHSPSASGRSNELG